MVGFELRRTHRAIAVMVLGAGVVGLTSHRARADASYDASAAAFAVNLAISNPSLPLGIVVGGEAPTAQAHQTSLQQSDALAAFPYPGDTVATFPGVVSTLYGIPLPGYPLFVTSQFGDKPKDQDFPGIALHVESGDAVTAARAISLSEGSGATATSRIDTTSAGEVTATAEATGDFATIGGVLRISGLHNEAEAHRSSDGALTRRSSLGFGRISAPGLALRLPASTPGSVPIPVPVPGVPQPPPLSLPVVPLPLVGGQTLTDPDIGFQDGYFTLTLPALGSKKFLVPAQPVLDAFKAIGITITYQPAIKTPTGIVAAGLTISTSLPSPPAALQGKTDLVASFGRAAASVQYAVEGSDAGWVPTGVGPATGEGGTSGQIPVAAGVSGLPGAPGSGSSPTDGSAVPAPQLATTQASLPGHVALRRPLTSGIAWIYLLFVAVGLSALTGSTAIRLLGVRLA